MVDSIVGRNMARVEGAGVYIVPEATLEQRRSNMKWLKERALDSDHPLAIWHEGHHFNQPCVKTCYVVAARVSPEGDGS